MNYWILTYGILIIFALTIIVMRPNWYLKIFVHKEDNPKHFAVERYTGMSVIGYKCHKCGHEWYEKRKHGKAIKEKE
jgi:hypothetical protein